MARRRPALFHGWLVIDKPAGPSSAAVVGRVRHLAGGTKAGHGGTLDPFATGVLPVALGEATKTVAFVMDGAKRYRFTVRWGAATSTDDAEGEVIAAHDHRPGTDALAQALAAFTGTVQQRPPIYSALKLDGRRAYALARAGETPSLAPRPVRIDALRLVSAERDEAVLEVDCGKGTYVRALARDLAEHLGTVGHVRALRRLRAGPFGASQAISLDYLAELSNSARFTEAMIPLEAALADIPALVLSRSDAERLRRGQSVPVSGPDEGTVCVMAEGRPAALGCIAAGGLRPVRVFNL